MTRILSKRIHVQVEQAIAYGRSDKWIRDRYQVPQSAVDAVRVYLERVHREPECVPHNIARDEMAAIYTALVPEHHSHAERLPQHQTGMERARLAGAARHLRRPVDRRETA